MERLSIIIPYSSDRQKHLDILLSRLKNLESDCFEIVPELSDEKPFNTGAVQNRAVEKCSNCWILKNDVDCIADDALYYYALGLINSNDFLDVPCYFGGFTIFGVEYLNQDGTINDRFIKCGNEYLFHKTSWSSIGGIPEWSGYFGEDYAFEYEMVDSWTRSQILKNKDNITPDNIHHIIRDNITIPENKKHPFWFKHMWHEKKTNIEHIKENQKKLYDLVMENR